MALVTEPYTEQVKIWPKEGRHILAQYDDHTIVVYQAYRPSIGRFAAARGTFGGDFSYSRMSWVKPNFLWMMYRSGWGSKEGQEVTLALRLRRAFFDSLLAEAVPSSWDRKLFAIVYIKKPGKMRWDYYGRPTATREARLTKSFISDGKELWAVQHDDKTAMRQALEKDLLPVAITFLYGKGDLTRDFDAELDSSGRYGTRHDYILKLTPRQPTAQYRHLWLVIDPRSFQVKQSIVANVNGETNAFQFLDNDTGRPIRDRSFVFRPGKEYRVLRPDRTR